MKVGSVDYTKISEDIKSFNAGIVRHSEVTRPRATSGAGLIGLDVEADSRDLSPHKTNDLLNDLLELSVQDILPTATKGEENLMDLGFEMPFVFDKNKAVSSEPTDLDLMTHAAQGLKSHDPFEFDVTPKSSAAISEPPKAPQPPTDDPFHFL